MKGIHKYKLSLIPLGLVAITLLSGYFLSHVTLGAHANTNKTSTVSVRVADTCSMTGEVTAEHSASLINGQSKTGIGTTELTTMCNDNNGYAIYAVGYGFLNSADMNSGTGTMGVTDLLGATSGLKISTANWADRNTGDNASKSIWSMTLLPWDSTSDPTRPVSNNPTIVNGYDSYMAVPSAYTKVASFPSSTITETATKSVVKTSYAAKIADIQTADTYVGQVKYTMVRPSSNTATGFTFDDAFQLAGKSRVSGTSYFAMQDMNAAICNKVTTPLTADAASTPQAQLIDIRDNKVYWVAKLMDGKCWMTQNLDLDLGSVALNSDNTNINPNTPVDSSTGYSLVDNKITWTPTRSTIDSTSYGNITTCSSESGSGTGCWGQTNTGFTSISGTNLWDNDPNTPYSANPGYRYMTFTDRADTNPAWYSNGDTFANCTTQDTNCGGQGHYMIGNYYNFAAANATNSVAGTVGHTVTDSDADFVMPNSICPKGWRMPIDQTTNNEFNTLLAAYSITGTGAFEFNFQGLNKVRRDPLYFARSGNVGGGILRNAGTNSLVWSSTISSSTEGYGLYFNGTDIYPANYHSRVNGFAVRCIFTSE